MVNFDTLATYAIQRFYSALDSGRLVTAYGVVKSFAVAFNQQDIVRELQDLRHRFKTLVGMDIIDVVSLGLFSIRHEIVFEVRKGKHKTETRSMSGYDIYRFMLNFQMELQELFDRALIQSMKQSTTTSEEASKEILEAFKGLEGVADLDGK